jgi:hypothetical protein
MYERLLDVTADSLFHDGEWKLLDVASSGDNSFGELIAYRWRLDQRLALVVANLGASTASGHVPVVADLPAGAGFDFTDVLSGATFRWARRSLDVRGLFVRLGAGDAHLFIVGGDPVVNLTVYSPGARGARGRSNCVTPSAAGSFIGVSARIGWRQRFRSVAPTRAGVPFASNAGTRRSNRSVRRNSRAGSGGASGF